jgi:hypothetical protein
LRLEPRPEPDEIGRRKLDLIAGQHCGSTEFVFDQQHFGAHSAGAGVLPKRIRPMARLGSGNDVRFACAV